MDYLDLVDTGGVDSGSDSEQEVEELGSGFDHGITKELLEANYKMLGSVAPQQTSSILLSELRGKHPQVHKCLSCLK